MSLGGPAVIVLFVLIACMSHIGPVSAVGSLSLLRSYRKAPARRYLNTAEIKARRQFELPHFQVLQALGIEIASLRLHELVSQVAVDLLPFKHGISLAMVEQVGEVVADDVVYSRHHNLKAQLMTLAARVELPDIDVVFTTADGVGPKTVEQQSTCPKRGPLFSQARHPYWPHLIAYPDFTFQDWPEANIPSWEVQGYIMQKASQRTQWQDRNPQLFFRGGLHPEQRGVAEDVNWQPLAEIYDVTFFSSPHDVGTVRGGFTPLPQHCNWKYLLNWPPQSSYSARLKSIMSCGSAVVSAGAESGWHEFWYHLLKDRENIILIPQIESVEDVAETLSHTVHNLRANDSGAQKIGEAGQRLMNGVLTPNNIRLYCSLQHFAPTRHPDAIAIGDSMHHPNFEQLPARLCKICSEKPP